MSEIRPHWISFVLLLTLGCDAEPPRATPRSEEGARAAVAAWQNAALVLEESGAGALEARIGTPFAFVGTSEMAGFRAETDDAVHDGLAVRERLALVHTAALVVKASGTDTTWDAPRRGEIVATLGGERGYVLTLRHGDDGWRVVRFEVRTTRPSERPE